jgi:cell division protein FtsI (penicillin-binding protein 3)
MKDRTRFYFKLRVFMVSIIFALCFGLIAIQSFKLQVLEREKSLKFAQNQYYSRKINLAPHRGTIYDSRGRELAASTWVPSLYGQPAKIKNKREVAAKLAPILGINARKIHTLLSSQKSFVWLQRRITPAQQAKIESLKFEGVGFIPESRRFYPNSEIGAHIIGFAGMDSQGLEGLEKVYDRFLKTAEKHMVLERDALGNWIYIPAGEEGLKSPYNLHLTVDLRVQYTAEKELRQGVKEMKAKGGMVVIMEPSTGKILAMAVQPSFNPNLFEEYSPDRWRNRTITDHFEPGSLLKVFLLAAVLEENIVKESDIFYCENGVYKVGVNTIHDIKRHGWLSLRDVIRLSSNIGAYKVGTRLGANRFYHYLEAFGFNEKTGVDLLGEARGSMRPPHSWYKIDLANISFGQGVSVTALQLITALSSIANGGNLVKPYLLERVTDGKGNIVKEFFPEVRRRTLSEETCHRITSILRSVVGRGGTGFLAKLAGYEVAGKTGTAQKVDLIKGGYSEDKIIASFMGYIPADDPRAAILVILDEPSKSSYGGVGAAPIFKNIAEELMRYMGIPPKEGDSKENDLLVKVTLSRKQKVEKEGEFPQHMMPDLHGLCMREALVRLEKQKVSVRLSGSGLLVSQRPHPRTPLKEGEEIFLKFAPTD